MRAWRAHAWDVYESTPLPTTQLEEWRYTDPKRLKYDVVGLAPQASTAIVPTAGAEWLASRTASGRVMQVGTRIVQAELDEELRAKGVILMDLNAAAAEYGELLENNFGRAVASRTGKFAALNGAFWDAGIFLYVP